MSFTERLLARTSRALFSWLKYPACTIIVRTVFYSPGRAFSDMRRTFKNWLGPVEIRSIIEVLPVEVQSLPKLQQRSQFLD